MGKLLRFPANRIVHTKPQEPELTEEESQKIKVENTYLGTMISVMNFFLFG